MANWVEQKSMRAAKPHFSSPHSSNYKIKTLVKNVKQIIELKVINTMWLAVTGAFEVK